MRRKWGVATVSTQRRRPGFASSHVFLIELGGLGAADDDAILLTWIPTARASPDQIQTAALMRCRLGIADYEIRSPR
jgi:hypothetical protein